jgi:very-short-patch-repair endonuclease
MIEDLGYTPRNRTEQQLARMKRMTKEERLLLTQKAHEATRGVPASKESRAKIARAHQAKGCRRNSELESAFLEMMTERGIKLAQQTAIETYNCDFTIDSIAVEIWGGNWHFTGEHAARFFERTNKIFDSGFDLIILPFFGKYQLTTEVADYIVSFLDELRRDPPATRQYWVIWGAGKAVVSGGRESINNALISPFVNRRNPSNGRYESVLR